MAITFNPQYVDQDDTRNDVPMYLQADPIPVISQDSEDAWTLNLMTIDWPAGPGHVEGSAVAVGASAERYIPGIIDGHLYKVTVHISASLDRLKVSFGGNELGYVGATGSGKVETKVWYIRPTDGNHLFELEHVDGTNFTGAIEIVTFEALDPMNLDIVPEATPRQVD